MISLTALLLVTGPWLSGVLNRLTKPTSQSARAEISGLVSRHTDSLLDTETLPQNHQITHEELSDLRIMIEPSALRMAP